MSPHRCAWCIFLLCFTPAVYAQDPVKKQPPKPGTLQVAELERDREHKLLAQLVEYLHCDTFPPDDKADEESKPLSSGQVKTFVEMRRKTLGSIRTRLRDTKADSALFELYDDYQSLLDKADKFGDKLRTHEDKYFGGIKAIRDKYKILNQINSLLGDARKLDRVAGTLGWWTWWDPYQNRTGLLAGLQISGMRCMATDLRTYANVLKLLLKYKDEVKRYEDNNLPLLLANLKREDRDFRRTLQSERGPLLAKSSKNVASLASTFEWQPGEVTMDPFAQVAHEKTKNPFLSLSMLNRVTNIKSTKQAEQCEKLAEKLLTVVGQLPAGSSGDSTIVYRKLQADLSFLAGVHANRAAEFQLGEAGFKSCVKSPTSAGSVAVRAFNRYADTHITLHPKAIWKHQEALAFAYAGKPGAAFSSVNEILERDLAGMDDPKFYYDCARLRCLGGNDSIPTSWKFMRAAALLGFRQVEKARSTPDLEMLRKTNNQLFEQILDVNK